MSTPVSPADQCASSWEQNADVWTLVVREDRVESRRLVTHAAILEAILRENPSSVVDVGCGEGWLCRALNQRGMVTVGIDGSSALIARARDADPAGDYRCRSYAEIAREALPPADLAVCNFALLDEDLHTFFRAAHVLLHPEGKLIIQTVHPLNLVPYHAGWREERFEGFGLPFPSPMPWFAHPLSAWVQEAGRAGWTLVSLEEPRHPETGRPLSLLLCYTRKT